MRFAESSPLAVTLCHAAALFFMQAGVPTWWSVVAETSGRHGAAMWGLMNSMASLGLMGINLFVGWVVDRRQDAGVDAIRAWTPVFDAVAIGLAARGGVLAAGRPRAVRGRARRRRIERRSRRMKIVEVRTYPITLPVRPEFVIVSSAGGHAVSRYVLVEVLADDGTSGWGEATVIPLWSGETQGGALAAINGILGPALVGRELSGLERRRRRSPRGWTRR